VIFVSKRRSTVSISKNWSLQPWRNLVRKYQRNTGTQTTTKRPGQVAVGNHSGCRTKSPAVEHSKTWHQP